MAVVGGYALVEYHICDTIGNPIGVRNDEFNNNDQNPNIGNRLTQTNVKTCRSSSTSLVLIHYACGLEFGTTIPVPQALQNIIVICKTTATVKVVIIEAVSQHIDCLNT